jgi:hypothetical protein
MIGRWRKLHNEELHNLQFSPNDQVKEDEIGMECSTHWREKDVAPLCVFIFINLYF